jgi:hypothetical protein
LEILHDTDFLSFFCVDGIFLPTFSVSSFFPPLLLPFPSFPILSSFFTTFLSFFSLLLSFPSLHSPNLDLYAPSLFSIHLHYTSWRFPSTAYFHLSHFPRMISIPLTFSSILSPSLYPTLLPTPPFLSSVTFIPDLLPLLPSLNPSLHPPFILPDPSSFYTSLLYPLFVPFHQFLPLLSPSLSSFLSPLSCLFCRRCLDMHFSTLRCLSHSSGQQLCSPRFTMRL